MKAKLFEHLSKNEIIDNLEAESVGIEECYTFLKPYTDEEREKVEAEYIDFSKKLETKEQEKREKLEPIQAQIKELKEITSNLRKCLAQGGEVVNEQAWMIPDYDERAVGLYDGRGILVGTTDMSNKMLQLHINSHKHLKEG